jgi:hypothetical protein
VRLGREDWTKLHPDDVAWVTEWQLAAAFPWVPVGGECPVRASAAASPDGGTWGVEVRAGSAWTAARLPVRELARVIRWCYGMRHADRLRHPPGRIRAALSVLRAALRPALRGIDPLESMGYARNRHARGGPAV